ncbi:MAG TPA: hypothetical protein DCZ00_00275 [Lactococcus sp.]|uniref:DUF722 domain-containing protein n=1 Tax=Lactococcus TaxID=1357 RepID=UPI000E997B3E|nr:MULTISPECIES: DUF722 domain-containing protein [Lactococcus]HAP15812.1 hypothetical protein [Lactococcus sp.]HBC89863.1 hypothetical protein [Lactococcus sp.]
MPKVDKLDRLIGDYLTGRLDAAIKMRELYLRRPKHQDSLGVQVQRNNTAPQEAAYIRVESDDRLAELKYQKEILDIYWSIADEDTKEALALYHKRGLNWSGVSIEMYISRKALYKINCKFKDSIRDLLSI